MAELPSNTYIKFRSKRSTTRRRGETRRPRLEYLQKLFPVSYHCDRKRIKNIGRKEEERGKESRKGRGRGKESSEKKHCPYFRMFSSAYDVYAFILVNTGIVSSARGPVER